MATLKNEIPASGKAAFMQQEQDILGRPNSLSWTELAGTVCDRCRFRVSVMHEDKSGFVANPHFMTENMKSAPMQKAVGTAG